MMIILPYLYKFCDLALPHHFQRDLVALYEPWLYQKAVLARRPAGFAYPQGMNFLLYDHFCTSEWICCKGKYYHYYSSFKGKLVREKQKIT